MTGLVTPVRAGSSERTAASDAGPADARGHVDDDRVGRAPQQGRARKPQLLGALARALRLTDSERDHLYRVAGAAPPSPRVVSQHIGPGVQRMLDRLGDSPLGVFSAAWDLLWWNPLWAALTGDPSALHGLERNIAWRHFTQPASSVQFSGAHAEEFSDDLAADLREAAGRYPEDCMLTELITRLRAESPDFARRWRRAHIARHRSSTKTATCTPSGRSPSTATS